MLVKKNDPLNVINLDETLEKMETLDFQLVKKTNMRKLFKLCSAMVLRFGNQGEIKFFIVFI